MSTAALPASQRPAIAEWFPVLLGLIALYIPTSIDLARTIWASEAQAYGPIILGVALWFFWKLRFAIHRSTRKSKTPTKFIAGYLPR